MIKIQPVKLLDINAFDATKAFTFHFLWNGNQARGSKLSIRKNLDNSIARVSTFTSMKLTHDLPANQLQNGVCYNASLEVLDADGNIISEPSKTILFYCYSTPDFAFVNITGDQLLQNSSYDVILRYNQEEGEPLTQYELTLYDLSKTPVQTKGIQYLPTPVTELTNTIYGLENNIAYYLRATGKTLNGMKVDTGYLPFSVRYIQPTAFTFVELSNVKENGYITIKSNLISARGESNPPENELTYIEGKMVDLTKEGTYIKFSESIEFPRDYAVGLTFKGVLLNKPIVCLPDAQYKANLFYREGRFQSQANALKGYFELQVETPIGLAIYTSNYINSISSNTFYTIWILKRNNIYEVRYREKEG